MNVAVTDFLAEILYNIIIAVSMMQRDNNNRVHSHLAYKEYSVNSARNYSVAKIFYASLIAN